MPAGCCACTTVALQVGPLFCSSECWGFQWINAHMNDFKVFSYGPFHVFKALDHAVENQGAEHWTLIVTEDEDGGFLTEIIAQANGFSIFIAELEIERKLRIELLIKSDLRKIFVRKRPTSTRRGPIHGKGNARYGKTNDAKAYDGKRQ